MNDKPFPILGLSLSSFKQMDYKAVNKYGLTVELMMENAGLQLARLVCKSAREDQKILIGAGNGNNGGGGLTAARRLAAWGFDVYLDLPLDINKPLPLKQLKRATAFGVKRETVESPHIWIDAYLGFSQRLPLSKPFLKAIERANRSSAHKISLDLPVGISEEEKSPLFSANQVLTLAAPKHILSVLPSDVKIFVADIGIPSSIYQEFGVEQPPFHQSQIIPLKNDFRKF